MNFLTQFRSFSPQATISFFLSYPDFLILNPFRLSQINLVFYWNYL